MEEFELDEETKDLLAQLTTSLASNPETRKDFLRLIKKTKPDFPIPEVDVEEKVEKLEKNISEKHKRLEEELLKEKALMMLERKRMELKRQGYSDEDIKKIEEIAEKYSVPYDKAMEIYNMGKPEEPTFKQKIGGVTAEEIEKDWFKNPKAFLRKAIEDTILKKRR